MTQRSRLGVASLVSTQPTAIDRDPEPPLPGLLNSLGPTVEMATTQPNAPSPWGIQQQGCSLVNLLLPGAILAAAVGLGRFGWNHWGGFGVAIGIVLAIPLVVLSIAVLGLLLVGFNFVFERAEFERQVRKTPPKSSKPLPSIPVAPPSTRRGAFRIRTFMIVTAVLALWLGIGLAMIRAASNDRDKNKAIAIVFLVPLGFFVHYHATKWTDRWFVNPKPPDRPKS